MANLFSKTKIIKAPSSVFKGGVNEKRELVKSAQYGFSKIQMDKKLKDLGYDSSRRKRIMDSMLGAVNSKSRKPSLDELAKTKKEDQEAKQLRVLMGRRLRDSEEYKRKKGGWYGNARSTGFARIGMNTKASSGFSAGPGKNNSLGINSGKNDGPGISKGERPKFAGTNR